MQAFVLIYRNLIYIIGLGYLYGVTIVVDCFVDRLKYFNNLWHTQNESTDVSPRNIIEF